MVMNLFLTQLTQIHTTLVLTHKFTTPYTLLIFLSPYPTIRTLHTFYFSPWPQSKDKFLKYHNWLLSDFFLTLVIHQIDLLGDLDHNESYDSVKILPSLQHHQILCIFGCFLIHSEKYEIMQKQTSFIPSSKKLSLSFFQILHTVFIYAFFFSDLFNGRFSVCANLSLAISKLLILWWIFILWHANNDLTCMSSAFVFSFVNKIFPAFDNSSSSQNFFMLLSIFESSPFAWQKYALVQWFCCKAVLWLSVDLPVQVHSNGDNYVIGFPNTPFTSFSE